MLGWFQDVTDSVGVSREKRGFLNIQIEINRAENCEQLWTHLIDALEMLNFDRCDLKLNGFCRLPGLAEDGKPHVLRWNRLNGNSNALQHTLRIDLPLVGSDKRWFGDMVLEKDIVDVEIGHYTLKRVEHLRRNIIKSMENFNSNPPS
jgi:UDP-GlcNAc:undecaprenyl-phosphate GlcNAc-1-phosphate transferase